MEWDAWLRFLCTPEGIKAATGVALVLGMQFLWPNWRKRKLNFRLLVVGGVCFGLPLLAAALGVWTEGWPAVYQITFWPALQAGAVAVVPTAIAEGLCLGGRAKEVVRKRRTSAHAS